MSNKVTRIDFGKARLASLADKYYNEGDFLSALRHAYKQLELYGGDGDVFARLADIYETMNLHGSAVNWWFRYLDIADEEDHPDIYEGIAVNFLNMGNETASAYYYNRLIDVDDTVSNEMKMEIAAAFSKEKQSPFRFVYPPQLADYSKDVEAGSRALKAGDCQAAISLLSVVEKGNKQYAEAREMQAVAHLLAGENDQAQAVCEELLADKPDDIRTMATLAAVYLEQGKKEDSKKLAEYLHTLTPTDPDDLYKIATVCCENGMHAQAYEKFCQLEEKIPFDGRMLYFKAVSAFKSGQYKQAERAFSELVTVYPDAEVANFYLKALRIYGEDADRGTETAKQNLPEPNYFYHLPQEEREARCKTLVHIKECPQDEAQLFGLIAWHDGYFRWCFDEMDGGDHDLQYLAVVTAAHVRADDFLREVLLDNDVLDVLKMETLRLLYERNEEDEFGVVLCNIYRRVTLLKVALGRKKRARFIRAYAKISSKFVVINDRYAERIKQATETLYRRLEANGALDVVESSDDCACAIFFQTGLKEFGGDYERIVRAFDANGERVARILEANEKRTEQKENVQDETD